MENNSPRMFNLATTISNTEVQTNIEQSTKENGVQIPMSQDWEQYAYSAI